MKRPPKQVIDVVLSILVLAAMIWFLGEDVFWDTVPPHQFWLQQH